MWVGHQPQTRFFHYFVFIFNCSVVGLKNYFFFFWFFPISFLEFIDANNNLKLVIAADTNSFVHSPSYAHYTTVSLLKIYWQEKKIVWNKKRRKLNRRRKKHNTHTYTHRGPHTYICARTMHTNILWTYWQVLACVVWHSVCIIRIEQCCCDLRHYEQYGRYRIYFDQKERIICRAAATAVVVVVVFIDVVILVSYTDYTRNTNTHCECSTISHFCAQTDIVQYI